MRETDNILDIPGVTYSRAGAATAFRADGTLAEFAPNVPRITDRGVLIEGQRTNLFPRWDPTVAQFSLHSGVVDATAPVLAPLPGRRWISLGPETQQNYAYQSATIAANTAYSFQVLVETPDNDPPLMGYATSDDFNMIVGSNGLLSSSYSYRRIAGNVWLATVVGTSVANPSAYSGIVRYIGQKRPLKFSGFQLEQASDASSPIITTGAAATRGQGILSLSRSLEAAEDFTIFAEAEFTRDTGTEVVIFEASDGTPSNRVRLVKTPINNIQGVLNINANFTSIGYVSRAGARIVKAGIVRSGAVYSLYVDGAIVASVTAAGMPALSTLRMGNSLTGPRLNDNLRRLSVLPYALTDAQLQAMTQ